VSAAAPPRTTATRPLVAIRIAPIAASRRSRLTARSIVARKAGLASSPARELTTAASA
jgi:hypothetical protein